MHRKSIFPLLCILLLTGCGQAFEPSYVQEVSQLHPEITLSGAEPAADTPESGREVLNYEEVRSTWIPYTLYGAWMTGKNEAEFRETVRTAWDNCKNSGLNTLYVHVRAFGDAYYPSALFARGEAWDGAYDPLAIMLEEAHARSLSVHAWVNPMRCAGAERLRSMDESLPLRKWYDDPDMNGTRLVQSGDMYYLNPAYPEVRELIAEGVTEIIRNYPVDGVHIDDYFYPTTDPAFDAAAFAESGASDLAGWRRENCTAMVKAIYAAVKAEDPALLFGISPQGNMTGNYEKLYADTALWCRSADCCDYMVPQLYYGFENSTCPFAETAALWCSTAENVRIIPGLAAYKVGKEDPWAGEGAQEWITDETVLSREAELILSMEGAAGAAFYSYETLFSPGSEAVSKEMEKIQKLWT